jgi:hypothetical protein
MAFNPLQSGSCDGCRVNIRRRQDGLHFDGRDNRFGEKSVDVPTKVDLGKIRLGEDNIELIPPLAWPRFSVEDLPRPYCNALAEVRFQEFPDESLAGHPFVKGVARVAGRLRHREQQSFEFVEMGL